MKCDEEKGEVEEHTQLQIPNCGKVGISINEKLETSDESVGNKRKRNTTGNERSDMTSEVKFSNKLIEDRQCEFYKTKNRTFIQLVEESRARHLNQEPEMTDLEKLKSLRYSLLRSKSIVNRKV